MYRSGRAAVVETASGITVTYDWRSVVTVTLPSTYQGAVCGLCGNYNGKPQDDMSTPSGQAAPDVATLGKSWRVALVPGCSSVCQGAQCQACSDSQREVYRGQKYCGIIADKRGPFRECRSHVDPAGFLEDCMYDACHYRGHHISICEAVAAYVAACQNLGVTVHSWRSDSFCRESLFMSDLKNVFFFFFLNVGYRNFLRYTLQSNYPSSPTYNLLSF